MDRQTPHHAVQNTTPPTSNDPKVGPLAMSLKHQITRARGLLKNLTGPQERKVQLRLLGELQMRLNMEIEVFRKYA